MVSGSELAVFQVGTVTAITSGLLAAFGASQQILDPDGTYISLSVVVALCTTCVYATYRVVRFISKLEERMKQLKEHHDDEVPPTE